MNGRDSTVDFEPLGTTTEKGHMNPPMSFPAPVSHHALDTRVRVAPGLPESGPDVPARAIATTFGARTGGRDVRRFTSSSFQMLAVRSVRGHPSARSVVPNPAPIPTPLEA
jgi:hypothetical protein